MKKFVSVTLSLCMVFTLTACGKSAEQKKIDSAVDYYKNEVGLTDEEAKELAAELYGTENNTSDSNEETNGTEEEWIGGINPIFYEVIDEFYGPTFDHTLYNKRGMGQSEFRATYGSPADYNKTYNYEELKYSIGIEDIIGTNANKHCYLSLGFDEDKFDFITGDFGFNKEVIHYYNLLTKKHMASQEFVDKYIEKHEYNNGTYTYSIPDNYDLLHMTYQELVELMGDSGYTCYVHYGENPYIGISWGTELTSKALAGTHYYYIDMEINGATGEVEFISLNGFDDLTLSISFNIDSAL